MTVEITTTDKVIHGKRRSRQTDTSNCKEFLRNARYDRFLSEKTVDITWHHFGEVLRCWSMVSHSIVSHPTHACWNNKLIR